MSIQMQSAVPSFLVVLWQVIKRTANRLLKLYHFPFIRRHLALMDFCFPFKAVNLAY